MDELLMRIWTFDRAVGRADKVSFFTSARDSFAIRAGLNDGRRGSVPYFWAIFTDPSNRGELLREGWKAVSKVFIVAVVMDVIYHYLVFRWFYPGEALIVAIIPAFIPLLADLRSGGSHRATWVKSCAGFKRKTFYSETT